MVRPLVPPRRDRGVFRRHEIFAPPPRMSTRGKPHGIWTYNLADIAKRDYRSILQRLAALKDPVDQYFDAVMVMADDEQLKQNRLATLSRLRQLFLDVADLSCIPTR